MKLPKLKLKLNINNILEIAAAIGLVAVAGYAIFYIGQRKFSFFSYSDMDRQQVLQVYQEVEKRLPILSRACKEKADGVSCRGIYLPESGLMTYYHFEDYPSKNKAKFNMYYIPNESWITDHSFIDRGRIKQIGGTRY